MIMPDDFAPGDQHTNRTDLIAVAPRDTFLDPKTRYWLVFSNEPEFNPFHISLTESKAEDATSLDGWKISDRRATKDGDQPWSTVALPIQMELLGTPFIRTNEADGPDLPGAGYNAHKTVAVVTPGIVSTGHLTEGLDRDHGNTGDYWLLDTIWGHSYRIEVEFGDSQTNGTGGSAWAYFIDGDRRGTCCDSDHNRNDGNTFLHIKHDRNQRYLIEIAAFDKLNTDSETYNGPYTITMTDIAGTERVASNLYQGTSTQLAISVGTSRQYAVSFTTSDHPVGYKLDRIRTHIPDWYADPELALHVNTSSDEPGANLCGFRNPKDVQHHLYWEVFPAPVTFLAPACAEVTLAASTTYWIVFAGSGYKPVVTDTDNQLTDGSGWTIGDVATTKTTGDWTDISGGGTIPVEIWSKELQNPLSVSLEVTSDPAHGSDSDTYGAGDVITFQVVFNQVVTVTGAPRLRFSVTGPGDEFATYQSGSGTDTLVFAYTVLTTDTDGIYLYADPLDYPDADADSIVGTRNNLPAVNEISGQDRRLEDHKIDGTITN